MNNRVGGLSKVAGRVDPAVADWLKDAQTNKAALTKKQKRDMQRLHVMYDLKPETKSAIVEAAKHQGTSASQMAAFLLEFAVKELRVGNEELKAALANGRSPSRTMKFEWNLDAPEDWLSTETRATVANGKI